MNASTLAKIGAALNLSSGDIRLMAGEMTAQEMRSVKAVLEAVKSRIEALAAIESEMQGDAVVPPDISATVLRLLKFEQRDAAYDGNLKLLAECNHAVSYFEGIAAPEPPT